MSLLKYHTERAAQVFATYPVYRNMVVKDGTFLNVIESCYKIHQRCLSSSRSSHNSNLLTGIGVKVDVEEYLLG